MPNVETSSSYRRSPLVLVADDDRDVRELYRSCFDTNGYRTKEAASGSDAIAAAIELVPDVLLTDYILPDLDGITIARRLKADSRTARIRILMLTGYPAADLDHRAVGAGIERVLVKPCLPQSIMREVSRTLSRGVSPAITRARSVVWDAHMFSNENVSVPVSEAARVRDEFEALPGLALTAEQARLIFDLERPVVEGILDGLVREGFLARTMHGAFFRPR
jgi:two-component system, cell cycle response regulator DivK